MKPTKLLLTAVVSLSFAGAARANTYGSVEPIPNPAVIDTQLLRDQSLEVRTAFASRVLQCGIVNDVIAALTTTGGITTVNALNSHFEVGAGGFMGHTNPAFVYTVIDAGPNGATLDDIAVLTNSLGFVLSQGSAFLLDADNPDSYGFSAHYVVVNFPAPPTIAQSAALFELVGSIDHELFDTDSSGYTQYGRAYLSLQSFVPDEQFIAGYVEAASRAGLEYTPIVAGQPSLFEGGADFPGNDWTENPRGQDYLSRIPAVSHDALRRLRRSHLNVVREVLRKLQRNDPAATEFRCR